MTQPKPLVLTHVRFIVDDFESTLSAYAAVFYVQGGVERALEYRAARLWRCAEPNGGEIEIIARDRAAEILGEGPQAQEPVTLLFSADDVDEAVDAFVSGG